MNEIKDIINEIFGINRAIGAPDLTKPVSGLLNSNDKTIYVAVDNHSHTAYVSL